MIMRMHSEPRCDEHGLGDMKIMGMMKPCVVCGKVCNTARIIIEEDGRNIGDVYGK